MKCNRTFLLVVLLAVLGGSILLPRSDAKKPATAEDKVKKLMQAKLEHAQKVLEGIALNDFKKIEKNAEELMVISKSAEWRPLKTPTYEVYSNEFRRITGELIKNAKKKNVDGAALNYVNLTLTCVKCHKHVREIRMTQISPSTEPVVRIESPLNKSNRDSVGN
jgi:hypothetical protein